MMKIGISIIIGLFFLLIGLLQNSGYFYSEEIYLLGIKELGKTNISGFLDFIQSYLIIPEYIDKLYSEYLLHFLNKYFQISFSQIFLGIIFIFYFVFTSIILMILSFLSEKKDKIIILFSLVVLYYILLHFLNLYSI